MNLVSVTVGVPVGAGVIVEVALGGAVGVRVGGRVLVETRVGASVGRLVLVAVCDGV